MKLFFHAGALLLSVFLYEAGAIETNYVKTTIVGVGNDLNGSTDKVGITFFDGLNREIQNQTNNSSLSTSANGIVDMGNQMLTNCKFYDASGKFVKNTLPFNCITNGSFVSATFNTINNNYLKSQYDKYPVNNSTDRDPFAYSEAKYYAEPKLSVYEMATPGIANAISSSNTTKKWVFGVGLDNVEIVQLPSYPDVKFSKGFIVTDLSPELLDALYIEFLTDDGRNIGFTKKDYYLTISKDPLGKYMQSIIDLGGRTVSTAARKAAGESGLVISHSEYDIFGNCLKDIPPLNNTSQILNNSIYSYNTLGMLIRKEVPDCNIETYDYDNAGRMILKKTLKRQNNNVEILVNQIGYSYDNLNRVVSIFDPATLKKYVSNHYDKITGLYEKKSEYNIPQNILSEIRNTHGRLVGSVSHCGNVNKPVNVIDIYSYDDDGNVEVTFKIVPGLPMQRISLYYDAHHRIIRDVNSIGTTSSEKIYEYDCLGRLSKITHLPDNKVIVSYEYNEFGQLKGKRFLGNLTTEFGYTIDSYVDSLISKNTDVLYEHTLSYLPDGNIEMDVVKYNGFTGSPTGDITRNFTYDLLNRLTNINASDDRLDGVYSYDDVGRFNSKVEGSLLSPGYSSITNYNYYDMTNQLKMAKNIASNDYLYDIFGNIVVDKQKKMIIEYDWRNLPVKFSMYNTIPATIQNEKTVDGKDKGIFIINGFTVQYHKASELAEFMRQEVAKNNGTNLLSTVTMLYDAKGKRVLKVESKI